MWIHRLLQFFSLFLITFFVYLVVLGFYKVAIAKLDIPEMYSAPAQAFQQVDIETVPSVSSYNDIPKRNIFGTVKEVKLDQAVSKEEFDKAQKTELNLKLWGTVVGTSQNSCAVIEDLKARKQGVYYTGEPILHATVKKIFADRVILDVNGKDERLDLNLKNDPNDRRIGSRSPLPAPRPPFATASFQPAVSNVNIKREQVNDAMKNINELMKQIRIMPHYQNGQPDGLRVSGIRPNSIFRKMGLRNGDIIKGVDSNRIESVDDALRMYESLKNSSQMKLELKRRGQDKTIEYNIN